VDGFDSLAELARKNKSRLSNSLTKLKRKLK
jgi:hypothetical protein